MKIKSSNGFTLIELIIVMVILGILAAVAIPRFSDFVATANKESEKAVLASIRAGLANYAANQIIATGIKTYPGGDAIDTEAEIIDATNGILEDWPDDWVIGVGAANTATFTASDDATHIYTYTSTGGNSYTLLPAVTTYHP